MNEPVSTKVADLQERERIEALYFDGFEQKLLAVFGNRQSMKNVLFPAMNLDGCLREYVDGQLCGVATLDTSKQRFLNVKFRHVRAEYGLWVGLWRLFLLLIFDHKVEPHEVYLDTLSVGKAFRGRGIGALLLKRIESYAREHRFRQISLDVVDSNPRAKQFYSRHGYKEVGYKPLPFFRKKLGFSGSYRMFKKVET